MRIRHAAAVLPVVLAFSLLAACGDSNSPKPVAAPAQSPAPAPVAAAPAPVAAPAAAVVPVAQETKPDPDRELAQRVKRALEGEDKIQGAGIDVTAKGGSVTLWGTTASDDERTRAGRIAYRMQGVTNVENKLVVVKGS